jgi:flagellin-like hook-associated protein FlgL
MIDIIQGSGAGNVLFLGNGNGSFAIGTSIGGLYKGLTLSDINRDGYLDFLSTNQGDVFSVQMGNGNGTFATAITYATGNTNLDSRGLVAQDFDGDGYTDVALLQSSASTIGMYLNNGDGTYRTGASVATSAAVIEVINAGDFNGDGALDLLAAGISGNFATYMANSQRVTSLESFDLLSRSSAHSALTKMRAAMTRIGAELGSLGAAQSRLGTILSNNRTAADTYISAESKIRDADVAGDSAQLIRRSILQQAAVSILAQANLEPQLAMTLIGRR